MYVNVTRPAQPPGVLAFATYLRLSGGGRWLNQARERGVKSIYVAAHVRTRRGPTNSSTGSRSIIWGRRWITTLRKLPKAAPINNPTITVHSGNMLNTLAQTEPRRHLRPR